MRKLVLKMTMSMDGFVCGPNGELDWMSGGDDPSDLDASVATLWEAGLHIVGSRTFLGFAGFWPTSDLPFAPPMNEIPKAVFTRKGLPGGPSAAQAVPSAKSWADAYVARGDLAEEITRLKQQPGKLIMAHGGTGFARSLVEAGLIDEYWLDVHPAVLGQGQSIFSGLPKPLALGLLRTTTYRHGVVFQVYRPVK